MKYLILFLLRRVHESKKKREFVAGWTSFTVCGKLRRLVKVKKVIFHSTHAFKFAFYVDL